MLVAVTCVASGVAVSLGPLSGPGTRNPPHVSLSRRAPK